ncbi:MAG: ABC transporter ATP-binding protein [Armatimonadota bacterium]|nr:ABC transporter ATP-binding protein [Armatimonadota bacterium]MDR5698121.1 ABC transporter ATP-binding protein [Armatimonadota bacterium]
MGRDAHLRLVDVRKRFGRTVAVDGVSLDVSEGEFVTLLGPSGCGKTTILRMVAGFQRPDEGDILVRGVRVTDVPAHRRNAAMVFQEYALFPHMTVAENVNYGLAMRRTPHRQAARRIAEVLELLGLTGQEHKFPHQLSGGQQQRVALARALVVEPEVLLLDEPLSNLDAKLRIRVRAEIRQLQRQLGKTTVYVTHDQEEALAISDRIAVIHHGRIQQVGTPQDVYHRPVNRFVADFVGLTNFLEVEAIRPGEVSFDGRPFAVPSSRAAAGRLTLVVRPEAVQLVRRPPQDGGNVVRGRIVTSSFLGLVTRYWVDAGGIRWVVDVPTSGEDALDGDVYLRVPPDRIHVLP